VQDGYTRLEYASFGAYNESENLPDILEHYKESNGCYPTKLLLYMIYRTRKTLNYCAQLNIEIPGPRLGRPPKDYVPNKKYIRQSEINRVEVERKISLSKGSHGL